MHSEKLGCSSAAQSWEEVCCFKQDESAHGTRPTDASRQNVARNHCALYSLEKERIIAKKSQADSAFRLFIWSFFPSPCRLFPPLSRVTHPLRGAADAALSISIDRIKPASGQSVSQPFVTPREGAGEGCARARVREVVTFGSGEILPHGSKAVP